MKTIRSPNLQNGESGVTVRMIAAPGFARGGLVAAAHAVRGAGRYGDDMLVHMNKREFEQLRQAWGEPSYHPDTGLPEYFDWLGLIKTAAPYVAGALQGKTQTDQANQNLAPLPDANMQRPLGNYTNAKKYIPQPKQSPQSYYNYGQGAETNFFKNNSLGAITGPIPAPLKGPQQYSPSGAAAVGGGLLSGGLQYLMQNPEVLKGLFKSGGRNVDWGTDGLPDKAFPGQKGDINAGDPGASYMGAGAAGGLSAAASAAGSGVTPWAAGTVTPELMTAAEEAAAEAGALPEFTAANLSALGSGSAAGAGAGATAGSASGAGAGAAGSTAATSGLGITPEVGGALGAGAIGAGVTYAALSTAPYRIQADWWKNLNTQLTQGKSGNATYDQYADPALVKYKAQTSLYRMLQSQGGDTSIIGGAKGNNIPQAFRDMAMKYGMLNADGSVNPNWRGVDPRTTGGGSTTAHGGGAGGTGSKAFAVGGPVMAPGPMAQPTMGGPQPMQPPMMGQPGGLGQLGGPIGGPGPSGGLPQPTMPQPRPNLPASGMGPNPAWSPIGSPQQNAMPPPAPNGLPPMVPPPGAQVPSPIPQSQPMGGLGPRGPAFGGIDRYNRRASGGAISGPGTGTSDDIPARLSDGEYVIPAHVVAALGDGSTAAGAKRLDELQRQVRLIAGRQMARGHHPKPSKPPIALLTGAQ